ncbi:MAG: FHA domain-containing protein [Anaerolineae bacterium]|nr:FHA domain-containing protein [Phycisphaerae bacterium]
MQVVLVMFRGEGERRSFSITRDVTVVGRREDCDFRIPLGEISRKHCRIIKDDETLKVEDLGSSNGTFHNGERVQSCELSPGDTLQVGSVAFVVQIDGTPVDEELQPVTAGSRRTEAPMGDPEDSQVTLQSSKTANGNGSHDSANGNGEFDPMSVLEAEGSGALPAIDDSKLASDSMMVDLAGNSASGEDLHSADQA